MPMIAPRAYGSQCGAPEAGERRHEVDAAAVGHASRRAPRRPPTRWMMPSPSRSHCTTAPPMKTLPSSAYSVRSSELPRDRRQQLCCATRPAVVPVFMQHEAAGAVGVLRHARARSSVWPKSAACWSPAIPAIGRPARPRAVDTSAVDLARGAHLGQQAARDAEERAAARRPTRRVWMLKSIVREALVTSVTCTAPPVSFQIEPGVDRCRRRARPARRASRAPGTLSSSQRDLACRRSRRRSTRPVLLADERRSWPSRLAARRRTRAVRRSCQTMALWTGSPGLAVPDDRRLALVGDADRGDVARPQPARGQRLARPPRSASPRSRSGRARPSRAAERSGGTPSARSPRSRRRGRRRWRASWWCPDRGRERIACGVSGRALLYTPAAFSRRTTSCVSRSRNFSVRSC